MTTELSDLEAPANGTHDSKDPMKVAAATRTHSRLDDALSWRNGRPTAPQGNKFADAETQVTLPTPSTDPGAITGLAGYDDDTRGAVAGVVNALGDLHKAQAQVIAARDAARSDVTLTDAAAALKVAAFADKVCEPATRKLDTAYKALEQSALQLEGDLKKSVGYAATGSFTAEIRAHVKGMSSSQRMQFLSEAVSRGDVVALGAVLGAPPYLSGLSAEIQAATLERHNLQRDPTGAKRLAFMRLAMEKVRMAGTAFLASREGLVGSRNATVRRLQEQQANAARPFGGGAA
jgi:hypothetical protein